MISKYVIILSCQVLNVLKNNIGRPTEKPCQMLPRRIFHIYISSSTLSVYISFATGLMYSLLYRLHVSPVLVC